MTRIRPILRDNLVGDGQPIVAALVTPGDRAKPRTTPVTHSYAAVSFYTSGRARVEQNGEWTLGEGDVLLVPAGEPHRFLEMRGGQYWGLSFCVPCFAAEGAATLLAPLERVRDGAAAVVHIPGARHAFLEGLFQELQDVVSGGRRAASDAVQTSLLTLILAEIDRAGGAHVAAGAAGSSVVGESLRYIERNCLRRLTLDEVAAAVGRSSAYDCADAGDRPQRRRLDRERANGGGSAPAAALR